MAGMLSSSSTTCIFFVNQHLQQGTSCLRFNSKPLLICIMDNWGVTFAAVWLKPRLIYLICLNPTVIQGVHPISVPLFKDLFLIKKDALSVSVEVGPSNNNNEGNKNCSCMLPTRRKTLSLFLIFRVQWNKVFLSKSREIAEEVDLKLNHQIEPRMISCWSDPDWYWVYFISQTSKFNQQLKSTEAVKILLGF